MKLSTRRNDPAEIAWEWLPRGSGRCDAHEYRMPHANGIPSLPPNTVFVRKPFSAEVVYDRLQHLLPEGQRPEPLKLRVASL